MKEAMYASSDHEGDGRTCSYWIELFEERLGDMKGARALEDADAYQAALLETASTAILALTAFSQQGVLEPELQTQSEKT